MERPDPSSRRLRRRRIPPAAAIARSRDWLPMRILRMDAHRPPSRPGSTPANTDELALDHSLTEAAS